MFFDEHFRPGTKRIRVYRRPRNTERLRCVQGVHPFKGSIVVVWADRYIMKNRQIELVFVNRNKNYIKGVLDLMSVYLYKPLVPISRYCIRRRVCIQLCGPSLICRFNPIKRTVTTSQQLKDLLILHRDRLSQDKMNRVINSMNNRCQQVLNREGYIFMKLSNYLKLIK